MVQIYWRTIKHQYESLFCTEPMIAIWTWQIKIFEIQAMKAEILILNGINIARSYQSHYQELHHMSYCQL
jgi:hypothetical protein